MTVDPIVTRDLILSFHRRLTGTETDYRVAADRHWAAFDAISAIRYRAMADGLEAARLLWLENIGSETSAAVNR